jgi:hypothetical protein
MRPVVRRARHAQARRDRDGAGPAERGPAGRLGPTAVRRRIRRRDGLPAHVRRRQWQREPSHLCRRGACGTPAPVRGDRVVPDRRRARYRRSAQVPRRKGASLGVPRQLLDARPGGHHARLRAGRSHVDAGLRPAPGTLAGTLPGEAPGCGASRGGPAPAASCARAPSSCARDLLLPHPSLRPLRHPSPSPSRRSPTRPKPPRPSPSPSPSPSLRPSRRLRPSSPAPPRR